MIRTAMPRAIVLRPELALVAALALLIAAFTLKLVRYAPVPSAGDAAWGSAATEKLMAVHGWRAEAPPEPRAGGLYRWQRFRRDGCPRPVAVAVLVGNAEGAELVRRDWGDDMIFLQDGGRTEAPSAFRRQLAALAASVRSLVAGKSASERPPVVAVMPAPLEAPGTCAGPSLSDWRRLFD